MQAVYAFKVDKSMAFKIFIAMCTYPQNQFHENVSVAMKKGPTPSSSFQLAFPHFWS